MDKNSKDIVEIEVPERYETLDGKRTRKRMILFFISFILLINAVWFADFYFTIIPKLNNSVEKSEVEKQIQRVKELEKKLIELEESCYDKTNTSE